MYFLKKIEPLPFQKNIFLNVKQVFATCLLEIKCFDDVIVAMVQP